MKKTSSSRWKHDHTFGQDERRAGEKRTLWVIAITFTMMVVEIAAGLAFGSMALLADGLHMGSHTVALGISVFAYIYARHHATDASFTFGTGKVNALGGFTGAILLAVFALMMVWESVHRLIDPTEILFNQAISVAVLGLIVNGVSVFILGDKGHHSHGHGHGHGNREHHHDHNLRSAYLHVLADALTSVTAIVALLTAKFFGWIWMDPLMGIVGAVMVFSWSWGLLKSTSAILLDRQASPQVSQTIRRAVESDGHSQVTDLHLWSIGSDDMLCAVVSIASPTPMTPAAYKKRIPVAKLVHLTIEVNPDSL